jgi:hypothetical protein
MLSKSYYAQYVEFICTPFINFLVFGLQVSAQSRGVNSEKLLSIDEDDLGRFNDYGSFRLLKRGEFICQTEKCKIPIPEAG